MWKTCYRYGVPPLFSSRHKLYYALRLKRIPSSSSMKKLWANEEGMKHDLYCFTCEKFDSPSSWMKELIKEDCLNPMTYQVNIQKCEGLDFSEGNVQTSRWGNRF